MKKILINTMLLVLFTSILFGCTNSSNRESVYIEIKDPMTGEYLSNKNNFYSINWQWDYDNLPEETVIELRFKAEKKYIDVPRYNDSLYYTNLYYTMSSSTYPSAIGSHTLNFGVSTGIGDYKNEHYFGTDLKLDITIFGKAELGKDTIVMVEHDLEYGSTFKSPLKKFKFTVPQGGFYKFETIDEKTNREKQLMVGVEKTSANSGNHYAEAKEGSNDREIILELEEGVNCLIVAGPHMVTDLLYYIVPNIDSSYILRITKMEDNT